MRHHVVVRVTLTFSDKRPLLLIPQSIHVDHDEVNPLEHDVTRDGSAAQRREDCTGDETDLAATSDSTASCGRAAAV
jgi:hypothetical protein